MANGATQAVAEPEEAADLPLFPTRDEAVRRSFDIHSVRTAHDSVLVAGVGSGGILHERNPPPERVLTLYRSRFTPEIALLVSPGLLDMHEGSLVGPILPLLLLDKPETGQTALRSPLGQIHVCALEFDGTSRPGGTDFYRHWIGPWELFRLEPHPHAVLRPQTEAAVARIGLLLERDLAAADVLEHLRRMTPDTSALVTPIIVHLLSRHHPALPAVSAPATSAPIVEARQTWKAPVLPPQPGPLRLLDAIDGEAPDTFANKLRGTWRINPASPPCATGRQVDIDFSLKELAAFARLRLEIRDSHHPALMKVLVNGWQVGCTALLIQKHRGSRLDYWIPEQAVQAGPIPGTLTVSLAFDRPEPEQHPQFPFHFALTSCALHVGPDAATAPVPEDPKELLVHFESLGDNCEFGFVQRHFGIERLGIFTFAGVQHLLNTISMLEGGFAGLGDTGTLESQEIMANIYRDPEPPEQFPEFYMRDHRYEFGFHTFKGPQHLSKEASLKENEAKLRYLRRKFIEDLEDGEKIFVFKDAFREDVNEIIALHELMTRFGDARLFWVTRPIEGRRAGAVEWIGPNLLRGYSANPHGDAQRFNADHWLDLCRSAFHAFGRQSGTPV